MFQKSSLLESAFVSPLLNLGLSIKEALAYYTKLAKRFDIEFVSTFPF